MVYKPRGDAEQRAAAEGLAVLLQTEMLDADEQYLASDLSKLVGRKYSEILFSPRGGVPTRSDIRMVLREAKIPFTGQNFYRGADLYAAQEKFEEMTLQAVPDIVESELARAGDTVEIPADSAAVRPPGRAPRFRGQAQVAPVTTTDTTPTGGIRATGRGVPAPVRQ